MDNWLEPLEALEGPTNSFIVTIRSVTGKAVGDEVQWRGSVEHTQSRERIYFLQYSRLNEFIAAHSATGAPPTFWSARFRRRWNKSIFGRLRERLKFASIE